MWLLCDQCLLSYLLPCIWSALDILPSYLKRKSWHSGGSSQALRKRGTGTSSASPNQEWTKLMETAFHTHMADIELNLVGRDWWESCISHHQCLKRMLNPTSVLFSMSPSKAIQTSHFLFCSQPVLEANYWLSLLSVQALDGTHSRWHASLLRKASYTSWLKLSLSFLLPW